MAEDADRASPREDAIRLLARRDYSRHELEGRLASKGHSAETIGECLDALAEQGLQSDARFAEAFLRSRLARGQGPLKVRAEMGQRGLSREAIDTALGEAEAAGELDWFALAAETLARRFAAPAETPRERARQERFLAGRGFTFEQVRHALEVAWQDEE
ncbi:regulatory protein RecX [Halomonas salifodinae]|uniref:regulatory protein RecX n=1 Tax=Halomonas salifodinae TaxID=438745 RepID=UPI0033A19DAC